MSVQTPEEVCRRLSRGVAPAAVCAGGKGVPLLSTPTPRTAGQWLQTGQESTVVELGGQGPSFGQWGLRTRGHRVPRGALGPPMPTNLLFLCQHLPEFSQLYLLLGLIDLGFLFVQKYNPSAPGPGTLACPDAQNPIPCPPLLGMAGVWA